MMKNNNTFKTLLVIQMVSILLGSCSIKEDRTVCPCILNLDYSLVRSDERVHDADNEHLYLMVPPQVAVPVNLGEYPQGQSMVISRKDALLSCYLGYSADRISGGRLVIPQGKDSDCFYSYHENLFIGPDTEEVSVTPRLCGEFTRVVVCFKDNDSATSEMSLQVHSTTNGLDLSTGRPTEGEFSCAMAPCDKESFAFNMPRQGGRDISIDVLCASDLQPLYTIDLAGNLDKASYDWNAESLPPLVIINIDRQNILIDVQIIDWDEAVYFNYYL